MYRVVKPFFDRKDENRGYLVGDLYPRQGLTVSEKRLEELASSKNRLGVPLIEKLAEKPAPEKTAEKKPAPKKKG